MQDISQGRTSAAGNESAEQDGTLRSLFCTTDYATVLPRLPGISNDLEVVRLLQVLLSRR